MEHFLITRFNVPIPGWEKDKAGSRTLHDGWMEERLTIFKSYCVPTVFGQSETNFKWLIYCDTQTNKKYSQAIAESIALIHHAEIRFVENFEDLKTDLNQLVASSPSEYFITSRVDNDDGLGKTYIQTIQDHFVPEDKTILNLGGGVLYDLQKKILTLLRDVRLNHFGSLIEKKNNTGEYLTIMGFSHHDPPADVKVIEVRCRYAWLKIIHDRNLNSRTIGVPVFSKKLLDHFHLDKDAIHISGFNSIQYFISRSIAVLKRKFNL